VTEETALQQHLSAAGVETMEDWEAMSHEAAAYREARRTAQQLEEQLAATLSGADQDTLRRQVDADGPLTEAEAQALATSSIGDSESDDEAISKLHIERDRLSERIDSARKREYALNLELTHAAAGSRPLNMIEEERAEAAARVTALEFEVDAAAHALSVIEEVARDRHARLAPRMSALAGEYLRAITDGAYSELHVSRDLAISIRIPETARIDDTPQNVLSKGTIDQIYLAMRLALVRVFSENGESIPMLLDDPFANYDDIRLRRALDVLKAIAKDHQVVLFTCREDVLEAALAAGAVQIEI
jgi:uncharacterized protein YhaN